MERSEALALLDEGDYLRLFGIRNPSAEKKQVVSRSLELEESHPHLALRIAEARILLLRTPLLYMSAWARRNEVVERFRHEEKQLSGAEGTAALWDYVRPVPGQPKEPSGVEGLTRRLEEEGFVSPVAPSPTADTSEARGAGAAPAPSARASSAKASDAAPAAELPSLSPGPSFVFPRLAAVPSLSVTFDARDFPPPAEGRGLSPLRKVLLALSTGAVIYVLLLVGTGVTSLKNGPPTGSARLYSADFSRWGTVNESGRSVMRVDGAYRIKLLPARTYGCWVGDEYDDMILKATLDLSSRTDGQFGLLFCVTGTSSYYLWGLRGTGEWWLDRIVDDMPETLALNESGAMPQGSVDLTVAVQGGRVDLWLGTRRVASIRPDPPPPKGGVGLWVSAEGEVFQVTASRFEVWGF